MVLWAESRPRPGMGQRFQRTVAGAHIQPQLRAPRTKAWFCLLSGQQHTLSQGRLRRFQQTLPCPLRPVPTSYPCSFFFSNSLSCAGFAFPWVAFITCPTKNPNSLSLPAR
jgi:hypothetical protein